MVNPVVGWENMCCLMRRTRANIL